MPFIALSNGPNYVAYGADLTAYAGLTGELRFTEHPFSSPAFPITYLDSILLSDQAIPEPSTFCFTGMGLSLLGWQLLRRQRRASF
jgi:hypothetical protein